LVSELIIDNFSEKFISQIKQFNDPTILLEETKDQSSETKWIVTFSISNLESFILYLQNEIKNLIEKIGQNPNPTSYQNNLVLSLWHSITGKNKAIQINNQNIQSLKESLKTNQEILKNLLPLKLFVTNLNTFSNTRIYSKSEDIKSEANMQKMFTGDQKYLIMQLANVLQPFEDFYANEKSRSKPTFRKQINLG
jgi:hypothetical protein